MTILEKLNSESRAIAEELFSRFPGMAEHAEVYIPVSDADIESYPGSLYVDYPISSESGLERITIHHRGDCFEIGCYYDGAKWPEEFQFLRALAKDRPLEVYIREFVELVMELPANSLRGGRSIRVILP